MSEQVQVIIRAEEESRDRWKQAAEAHGVSMAEFVRNAANAAATEILECSHPLESRRVFPWAWRCLKCGEKFKTP